MEIRELIEKVRENVKKVLELIARNDEMFKDEKVQELLKIEDLETALRKHSGYVGFYNGVRASIQATLNECKRVLEIVDGELYAYYKTDYEVALGTNEVKYYITHDKIHRELVNYINVLEHWLDRLNGIVSTFDSRGYTLNNLVRLKQVELDRYRLEMTGQ